MKGNRQDIEAVDAGVQDVGNEPDSKGRPRSNRPATCLRLSLTPDLSELAKTRALVDELALLVPLGPDRLFDVKVALSEACANAIEHARSITQVVAWLLRDRILLEVTNDGPFLSGLSKDTDQRRRGLGLPLMAALSDQLHLSQTPEGFTRVSLTFLLAPPHPEELPDGPDQLVSQLTAKRQMIEAAQAELRAVEEGKKSDDDRLSASMSEVAELVASVASCPTPSGRAEALLDWARRLSGCSGGMVRLGKVRSEGERYLPAAVHFGLTDAFMKDEGSIRADECMCGRVCMGLTDAALPFFTKAGAFVWGRAQSLTEEFALETLGEVRGRCIEEGFESVAVFPVVGLDGSPVGALHLVDHRRHAFAETARTLEWGCRLSGSLFSG